MKASLHRVIFVDLELTCGYGPEIKGPIRQPEIIEIGVAEVNTVDLEITKTDSHLVRPRLGHVTEYCEKLTGITQELLNTEAISWPKAVKLVRNKFGSQNRVWYAYGDDVKFIEHACSVHNCPSPVGPKHVDLCLLYCHIFGEPEKRALERAMNEQSVQMTHESHRALPDAIHAANLWIEMAKKFRN
jgi:inhibitor of KinA sporulation pathway (predicted exonuclease)